LNLVHFLIGEVILLRRKNALGWRNSKLYERVRLSILRNAASPIAIGGHMWRQLKKDWSCLAAQPSQAILQQPE
jgi:hypothetical protein